jgi:hypothetical protein
VRVFCRLAWVLDSAFSAVMEEMLFRIESAMGCISLLCPFAPALGSFVWACFEAPCVEKEVVLDRHLIGYP